MNRFMMLIAAAAGLSLSAPALADDTPLRDRDVTRDRDATAAHEAMRDRLRDHDQDQARDRMRDHDAARKAADDALASRADMPAHPPMLPATASDHARDAHENIAFGKHGEAMREAHQQAGMHRHADDDHAEAGHHGEHGRGMAAGAAGGANADMHDAAEHAREHEMGGMHTQTPAPGETPTGGMPGPSHRR